MKSMVAVRNYSTKILIEKKTKQTNRGGRSGGWIKDMEFSGVK